MCSCLLFLFVPHLPVICRISLREGIFLSFIREKSVKQFGQCIKLAGKSLIKNFLKLCRIQKGVQTNKKDALGRRMAKDCPL